MARWLSGTKRCLISCDASTKPCVSDRDAAQSQAVPAYLHCNAQTPDVPVPVRSERRFTTICGALHPRCCDRPSWNTQHLPFVNPVLYNWSVFNAPTSHQRMLSSWKLEAGSDGSHGLPGAAALTVDNAQGPGSTDPPAALTLSSCVGGRLLFTCHASKCRPVQWGNVWPHSVGWKIKWKHISIKSKWAYQRSALRSHDVMSWKK